jgi:methyl-accepting chemotaxis protein-1 (serine sensor receptor)
MSTLKVSTRLALTTGVLVLLLLAVGALGLLGMASTNRALQTVYADRVVPLGQIARMQALQSERQEALHEATERRDAAHVQQALTTAQRTLEEQAALWDAYRATYLTPEEQRLADQLATELAAYRRDGVEPLLAALRSGDFTAAVALIDGPLNTRLAGVMQLQQRLVQLQLDVARQENEAAAALFRTELLLIAGAILAGVAAAAGLGWWITRSLTRQLGAEPHEVVTLAHAVAQGQLDTDIALRAGDQASLMVALAQMRDSLLLTVSAVRRDADGVATASSEIAQGTQDLSQRTEEQASALQQTAASMEQLGTTVRQNADNAQAASALAERTASVAQRGGQVVQDVVATMHDIEDSSRRITQIVGTIDGIAFQTNILALNAAVEAARAGEQGRGFAVVASEVRTLAQRAAEAAREVKTLIAASTERVDLGAQRVADAGATMREIELAVSQLRERITAISAASAEQSAGVQQIGDAVSQMDQVTQQNAALVEESSAAAESLRQQAAHLLEAVSVFRLGAAAPAQPGATPAQRAQQALARAAATARTTPARATGAAPAAAHAAAEWTTH